MITDTRPMPAEYLHSQKCLAHALICAVENIRDEQGQTAHDFRLRMQDGEALAQADDYLTSGTASCLCHDWQLREAGGFYDAVCACGWESGAYDTAAHAMTQGQRHAAAMVSRAWEQVGA